MPPGRSRASWRSRRSRHRCRGPDLRLCLSMGNYIFTTSTLVDALRTDAESTSASTTWGQHHPPAHRGGRGLRVRLRPQPGARRDRAGARLLAGRRHPRRLLPGEHGPGVGRADLQPVQHGLADPLPGIFPTLRPSSSTRAATGQGGRSTRWSLTAPWCRVDWSGVRSCHRDAGSTPMPWWRTRALRKRPVPAGTRS